MSEASPLLSELINLLVLFILVQCTGNQLQGNDRGDDRSCGQVGLARGLGLGLGLERRLVDKARARARAKELS